MLPAVCAAFTVDLSQSSMINPPRFRFPLVAILLVMVVVGDAIAQRRDPVLPTEAQQKRIEEGVAMHDRQQFDSAIAVYTELLKENADYVDALYELSYTYLEKAEYRKAAEIAARGTEYNSEMLPLFYVTLGTSLDAIGQTQRAIDAYERGLKEFPDNYLLHYNVGVTYATMKSYGNAGESFKRSAAARPDHPSSHFGLGNIFLITRYRVPAICALSRFLVLEPQSTRSDAAVAALGTLLDPPPLPPDDGTMKGRKERKKAERAAMAGLNKTGEGDFSTVEQALLRGTGRPLDTMGEKSSVERALDKFKIIFSTLASMGPKDYKRSFVGDFYRPYFAEMYRKGYVEPFCYYINQSSSNVQIRKWLKANDEWVKEFIDWSQGYHWPIPAK